MKILHQRKTMNQEQKNLQQKKKIMQQKKNKQLKRKSLLMATVRHPTDWSRVMFLVGEVSVARSKSVHERNVPSYAIKKNCAILLNTATLMEYAISIGKVLQPQ